MKKRQCFLFCIFFTILIKTASADPVSVHGKIMEKGSGAPIMGAAIYLSDNDAINTISDEDGNFTLSLPTPGEYSLGTVAVGFKSETGIEITVGDNPHNRIAIYLRQDYTIPPVVVRSERNPSRLSKSVMTGEEMREVPGAGGDPIKALHTLPGVAMGNDASGAPAIRGSSPEDNLYYVDGVPVGYLFHMGGLVSVLPASIVDSFNLYAAAFGPEYDDATGAVIDVALRAPRTDRPGGKINLSLVGVDGVMEGPVTPHQSVMFSARRSYFDILLGTIEDKDKGEKIAIPRYFDYQGKYKFDINSGNILTANISGASDNLGFTLSENPDNETKHEPFLIGSSSFDQSYHTQNITLNTRITPTSINKIYVGHTLNRESNSIGTAGTIDVAFNTLFLRNEFNFEPTVDHSVTVGGKYSRMDVKLNLDILDVPCDQFSGYCDYASAERKQYINDFPVHSQLLFAKDRWRITPHLTLTGGLHWTHDDYLDKSYTEPRLGAEWALSPRTLLTAGWGLYNQFPRGVTVIEVFGNPDLQRLRATHNVLGVEQTLDEGWSWKLEGYYKSFDDLVVTNVNTNYINGASGKAHGAELLVKKKMSSNWSGWLSATYSQSRRRVDATGETIPLSFDQPIIATGVLSYKPSPDWSFGARWTYHTGNPYTPIEGGTLRDDGKTYTPNQGAINSHRLPAYHRLDLRIERHRLYNTWKMNMYLEVINAYNQKNIAGYEYNANYTTRKNIYQLPIVPFVGVEMEF